jgi:hypothetical protein
MFISKIPRIICCLILLNLNWVEISDVSRRRSRVSLNLRSSAGKRAQVTHSTFKTNEVHFVDWLISSLHNTKMSIFVHSWNFPFKTIHEVWCLSCLRLIRRITRMFWWRLCKSRSWEPWIFRVVPVQVHFLIVFQRRQLLRIEHFLNAVLRYPSFLFYVAILLIKSCILLNFRGIIVLT